MLDEIQRNCGQKKYQEYAKTRNQVKSAIRKAKANMVVVFLSSPSSDLNFSSDIPVLVFLLELAYFQKILGLLLAFCAILRNTTIFLWMLKPYRRLKRNIDVGLDTEKLGTKKSTRNTPKQEIKLKAQSEKQKLIWRKKLHKMLKAIPKRFLGAAVVLIVW
jgi:predicted nucleotidyltransferase